MKYDSKSAKLIRLHNDYEKEVDSHKNTIEYIVKKKFEFSIFYDNTIEISYIDSDIVSVSVFESNKFAKEVSFPIYLLDCDSKVELDFAIQSWLNEG